MSLTCPEEDFATTKARCKLHASPCRPTCLWEVGGPDASSGSRRWWWSCGYFDDSASFGHKMAGRGFDSFEEKLLPMSQIAAARSR